MTRSEMLDRVVACYPRWWRDVYGSEVRQLTDDLLADGHGAWRLAVNLAWGAARARIGARGMPMQPELWAARSRVSIAVATLPWLVVQPFLVLGLDGPTVDHVLHGQDALRRAHAIADRTGVHVIGYMYDVLGYAQVIALVAVIVGWSALSQATSTKRSAQRLVNMPLYFLPVLVGLYLGRTFELNRAWTSHGSGPPIPLHSNGPLAGPLLVALWVVLVLGVVASSVALGTVARREDVPLRTIRRGGHVATVVALGLCCMTVCAVAGAVLAGTNEVVEGVGRSLATFHVVAASVSVREYRWSFLAVPLAVAAVASVAGWFASQEAVRRLSVAQGPGTVVTLAPPPRLRGR